MKVIFISVHMEDLRERQREREVKGEGERERGAYREMNAETNKETVHHSTGVCTACLSN